MFNNKKKEDKMSNNRVWLVIEKNVYGENSQSFSVAKFSDTIEGAVKFKVHLEALNDRKSQTYFLASDSDTVMDKVVSAHNESVSNGTYYEKHPEVKKPSEEEMPF